MIYNYIDTVLKIYFRSVVDLAVLNSGGRPSKKNVYWVRKKTSDPWKAMFFFYSICVLLPFLRLFDNTNRGIIDCGGGIKIFPYFFDTREPLEIFVTFLSQKKLLHEFFVYYLVYCACHQRVKDILPSVLDRKLETGGTLTNKYRYFFFHSFNF